MSGLGRWEPFTVEQVLALMDGAPVSWWLSGGYALDRFVGRTIRSHGDIDISLAAEDWDPFAAHVSSRLELWNARNGELTPATAAPWHNVWARESGDSAWRLQVNLEPVVDGVWHYRRAPGVTRPLAEVVLRDGALPYAAPAVQLLWKSKSRRPRDDVDFAAVLPPLPPEERAWLDQATALAHPSTVG